MKDKVILYLLMLFFLLCGLTTTLNDVLIPFLQDFLELNYTKVMLLHLAFYTGYLLFSPIGGKSVDALGYSYTLYLGLGLTTIGSLFIVPASYFCSFSFFLCVNFFLGAGITVLQVCGNPLTLNLGNKDTACSRLTLVQAFTSLGTSSAPFLGAMCIASAQISSPTSSLKLTYLSLACVWFSFMILLFFIRFPKQRKEKKESSFQISRSLKFTFTALLTYVGLEVCLGSFLVRFIEQEQIGNLNLAHAARLSSVYWFGFFIGRFTGSWLLRHIHENVLLISSASIGATLLSLVLLKTGTTAMIAVLSTGLCNSMMFPIIFSIGLKNVPQKEQGQAAGFLCMANIGGALLPLLQGFIADTCSLQFSFIVPFIGFGYVLYYAYRMQANPPLAAFKSL